jgi:hypothetical protein
MATVDANQPGSLCALLHSPSPDASGTDTMPRAHVVIIHFPLSTTTRRTTSRARGCRRQRPTVCRTFPRLSGRESEDIAPCRNVTAFSFSCERSGIVLRAGVHL